jgi:GDP-mannose transporter
MSNKKNEDVEMRAVDGDMGEKDPFLGSSAPVTRPRRESTAGSYFGKLDNNPGASIIAYCMASISMTVVNKYVVSGSSWNLNFFYLAIQVCICFVAVGGTKTGWLTVASRLCARSPFFFPGRLA